MKPLLRTAGIAAATAGTLAVIVKAVKSHPRATLRAYGIGKRWKADIEGARSQDLPGIIKAVALYCPPMQGGEPDGTSRVADKPCDYDTIAVDFDGTLCVDRFPEIGEPKPLVIEYVKHHAARGTKIILHTCRENTARRALLDEAVEFCNIYEIPLYAVNENPDNPYPAQYGAERAGRKVYADLYIDDKAVNPADIERTTE